RTSECAADVRKVLEVRPYCSCSFRLANEADSDGRIDALAYTVAQGIDYFRQKMIAEQAALYLAFGEISKKHQDEETISKVKDLVPALEASRDFPVLTASQIHI